MHKQSLWLCYRTRMLLTEQQLKSLFAQNCSSNVIKMLNLLYNSISSGQCHFTSVKFKHHRVILLFSQSNTTSWQCKVAKRRNVFFFFFTNNLNQSIIRDPVIITYYRKCFKKVFKLLLVDV